MAKKGKDKEVVVAEAEDGEHKAKKQKKDKTKAKDTPDEAAAMPPSKKDKKDKKKKKDKDADGNPPKDKKSKKRVRDEDEDEGEDNQEVAEPEETPQPTPAPALKLHEPNGAEAKAESATVFVANLSYSVDDDGIRECFQDCGKITNIKWLSDRQSGRFKGCGFLDFESPQAAAAAIAKNGEDFLGRPLKVNAAEQRSGGAGAGAGRGSASPHEPGEPNVEVFVGNLDFRAEEDAIKDVLKACGEITNVRWINDRETGEFKGAGFIAFADLEASAKAIALNGTDFMGRPLKVSYAKGRPDRPERGGGGKKFENKLSEKPEGCTKIFCGNLSYEVDDSAIMDFFKDCGEVTGVRWLTDKVSGDFKGVGFIDFGSEAAVDLAVKKAGQVLLGRPIRIDFAS